MWGVGNSGAVTITVTNSETGKQVSSTVAAPAPPHAHRSGGGAGWMAVVTAPATASATVTATDAGSGGTISLQNVAFGDVILCGGQSNMGFGMCGASKPNAQTPAEAFDMVAESNLRLFFQSGSGPNGGAGGKGCPTSVPGETSITPALRWTTVNRTNVGGASAVCMLTAHALAEAMPGVPVGAVESCVSGNVKIRKQRTPSYRR